MTTTSHRQTADERREAVLIAATHEFAVKGLHGASTEDIARAAGISQPVRAPGPVMAAGVA